jgi:hypothetical protein
MSETGNLRKISNLCIIVAIFMFIFSCCSTKKSLYSDNPNQKREDEVRKIMRDHYISSGIEDSKYHTAKERGELRRMKSDFIINRMIFIIRLM